MSTAAIFSSDEHAEKIETVIADTATNKNLLLIKKLI